ncbi:hypothetical protein V8C86DRAFT_2612763, partial [Haematococcus lacustris]
MTLPHNPSLRALLHQPPGDPLVLHLLTPTTRCRWPGQHGRRHGVGQGTSFPHTLPAPRPCAKAAGCRLNCLQATLLDSVGPGTALPCTLASRPHSSTACWRLGRLQGTLLLSPEGLGVGGGWVSGWRGPAQVHGRRLLGGCCLLTLIRAVGLLPAHTPTATLSTTPPLAAPPKAAMVSTPAQVPQEGGDGQRLLLCRLLYRRCTATGAAPSALSHLRAWTSLSANRCSAQLPPHRAAGTGCGCCTTSLPRRSLAPWAAANLQTATLHIFVVCGIAHLCDQRQGAVQVLQQPGRGCALVRHVVQALQQQARQHH